MTATAAFDDASWQQRVDAYLAAVHAACGDSEVVDALRAQIHEALEHETPEAVLAGLEPPGRFRSGAPAAPPLPTAAEAPPLRWPLLALAVLLAGVPAAFAVGTTFGEEAGGTTMIASWLAAGALAWAGRRHPVGRAALVGTAALVALSLAVAVFDL